MFKKKTNSNLAVALLLGAVFSSAHAQNIASPIVPPGTEVVVKTVDAMSSKTAKTGDKFAVVVAHDVVVDQQVVIAAGTHGTGTVLFGRPRASGGVPGALDVRIDSVDTPNGPLKLKSSDSNRGADRRNAGTSASLAFGIIGFLSVKGEELIMNPGTEIHTIVAMPRNIAVSDAATSNNASTIAASTTASTPAQTVVAESVVETPVSVTPSEAPQKENK